MITLDAVRAAVLAEKPYTQMDELVRSELAAGHKVNDIIESLRPLIDDVLDTPSLSEAGDEAFLGTLDKLTGDCHRDCRYVDPPDVTPTAPTSAARTPAIASGAPRPDDVRV